MFRKSISVWMYLSEPHGISKPYATRRLWYIDWCARYGKYLWTSTLFGYSLATMWSISCTGLHSYQQGSIVPWPHPEKNPKWDQPHIFHIPLWKVSPCKFTTNVWHGGETWGVWRWSFPWKKKIENINNLLIDVQNYPSFRGFLGCVRVIVLKWVKLETQLAILGPRRGHALRNNKE